MLERDVQERFIDFITAKTVIPDEPRNPVRIYKELVHYRFEEVMKAAMPDFTKLLDAKRLDTLIFEFIQTKPTTPFVWKISGLFRDFLIKEKKVEDFAFADDLMWFESVEVELLMGQYDKPLYAKFDWDEKFSLSKSAKMKVLHYAVNKEEFTKVHSTAEFLDEHPLIMYYHFKEASVYFQEVTPFMNRFLLKLGDMLPSEALKSICVDFEIEEVDEVRELLEGALLEYASLNIISKNIQQN